MSETQHKISVGNSRVYRWLKVGEYIDHEDQYRDDLGEWYPTTNATKKVTHPFTYRTKKRK